jgi:hypothetical protein
MNRTHADAEQRRAPGRGRMRWMVCSASFASRGPSGVAPSTLEELRPEAMARFENRRAGPVRAGAGRTRGGE